jgi:hypothetical protein
LHLNWWAIVRIIFLNLFRFGIGKRWDEMLLNIALTNVHSQKLSSELWDHVWRLTLRSEGMSKPTLESWVRNQNRVWFIQSIAGSGWLSRLRSMRRRNKLHFPSGISECMCSVDKSSGSKEVDDPVHGCLRMMQFTMDPTPLLAHGHWYPVHVSFCVRVRGCEFVPSKLY